MAASPLSSAPPSHPLATRPLPVQRSARPSAMRCCNVAAQMFNERGFHATSLDDMPAHLNVTKPTLYYYVKNKEEILLACMETGLGR